MGFAFSVGTRGGIFWKWNISSPSLLSGGQKTPAAVYVWNKLQTNFIWDEETAERMEGENDDGNQKATSTKQHKYNIWFSKASWPQPATVCFRMSPGICSCSLSRIKWIFCHSLTCIKIKKTSGYPCSFLYVSLLCIHQEVDATLQGTDGL